MDKKKSPADYRAEFDTKRKRVCEMDSNTVVDTCQYFEGRFKKVPDRLANLLQAIDGRRDGWNEALVLNQLREWIRWKQKRYGSERTLVYNTIRAWAEQFPWGKSTTHRLLKRLEKLGVIYVLGPVNVTRYGIDYDRLEELGKVKLANFARGGRR